MLAVFGVTEPTKKQVFIYFNNLFADLYMHMYTFNKKYLENKWCPFAEYYDKMESTIRCNMVIQPLQVHMGVWRGVSKRIEDGRTSLALWADHL
jgi:hypothetical protein